MAPRTPPEPQSVLGERSLIKGLQSVIPLGAFVSCELKKKRGSVNILTASAMLQNLLLKHGARLSWQRAMLPCLSPALRAFIERNTYEQYTTVVLQNGFSRFREFAVTRATTLCACGVAAGVAHLLVDEAKRSVAATKHLLCTKLPLSKKQLI